MSEPFTLIDALEIWWRLKLNRMLIWAEKKAVALQRWGREHK